LETALSGGGPTPWSWFISELCESFGCTPLQVLRDLGYQLEAIPVLVLEEVLSFRAYAHAREAVLSAERNDTKLEGDAAELVRRIRSDVQRAQLAEMLGADFD
jgi:hypothetical protein